MTQFLKKNTKLMYLLFIVFAFAFVVIACIFITPYKGIAVDYSLAYVNGTEPAPSITGLRKFCNTASWDYYECFDLLYDTNAKLQTANNMMLYLGVVSVIMAAIMFICMNHSRKKYYISNLVSGIVCPSVCIIMGIITIVTIINALIKLSPNLYTLGWLVQGNGDYYNQACIDYVADPEFIKSPISTIPLVIYIIVIALFIVAAAGLIVYTVYRYKDTKKSLSFSGEVADLNE